VAIAGRTLDGLPKVSLWTDGSTEGAMVLSRDVARLGDPSTNAAANRAIRTALIRLSTPADGRAD